MSIKKAESWGFAIAGKQPLPPAAEQLHGSDGIVADAVKEAIAQLSRHHTLSEGLTSSSGVSPLPYSRTQSLVHLRMVHTYLSAQLAIVEAEYDRINSQKTEVDDV